MKLRKLLGLGILATALASSSTMPIQAQAEVAVNGDSTSANEYVETEENRKIRLEKEAELEVAMSNQTKSENAVTSSYTRANTQSSMKINLGCTIYAQSTPYYCGPATCKIVLKHFGVSKSQDEIAKSLGTTKDGTIFDNIAPTLNSYQKKNT